MHPPQVLVVDDDLEIRKLLARYLKGQGLRVQLASRCADARECISNYQVDLIILDVMLPDGSGLDLCRDLRTMRSKIPVILLTALKEDVDRIIGLEIGAADYLGKPFNPRELAARIRAVLRRDKDNRSIQSDASCYFFEGFRADPFARSVINSEGSEVELTGAEFNLLLTFLDRPGRVLSRDQLFDLVYGRDGDALDRSIDVLISRLRRKLANGESNQMFKTVRNGGYQLVAKVTQSDGQR
ncbi:response regulator transcription factor [Pseudorhodoplanes sinuspersici]|uniref:Regulatory protein VirG n=1 Tax=Pseudorhodoplanes sinuspersici TaxID=1235591 RepID=A0A1W6ZKB7_9HYPH|nr:response regulator transcription factor [Pseudorhodoplanes sinuspersici]ARP97863.1 DNA-binding response regulator [Pseudorhodoplanes sinuspersici]RKE68403.1 winged helix family two component transcriptional regulator [Pseudorhodoplanes sinuspersici]